MTAIATLLGPFWRSWKNDLSRGGLRLGRRAGLLAIGAGFWLGVYYVVRRVLIYFQSIYDLGPGLAYQLLLIILLTFLSMLLFSNLITALSSFFLARDLDLVLSTRVPMGSFYYSRLITTAVNSSWMMLFFSLPVFAAYGTVFGGGWEYYFWLGITLPLFLIIPAALGVLVTHLLVYLLPAQRIREVLFFIGLFSFIVVYLLFRFSQPERLVQPESFGHFLEFLAAMEAPSSPFLPSSWSAEVLARPLFNRATDHGFFYALLASYALFLPWVTGCVSSAVYLSGRSKAQESRRGRRQSERFEHALETLLRPVPGVLRALMIRDVKIFLRDSTQWSQLFLLLALVVVYLYNFKVLPLDRAPIPTETLKTMIGFANLALAGFVLSSVAIRFAFPAVSLEGRAFWIVQTAPIGLTAVLWSKFWLYLMPLLILGEILVFLSNLLLQVPAWMMALSLVTVFAMALGMTAIAVGVGALYPKFDFDHAAEIPTSFGGAICMIFGVGFIGLTVMVEAWPIYYLGMKSFRSAAPAAPEVGLLAPSLIAVAGLTAAAVVVPIRLGLKSLERLRA
ncbi:MAG TPA: hypothetical protein VNN77_17535 [candidate division Zixibacteria bacterium]|nr:hypothetical protein [candidate division Zixibacteria bacterium]